jgi:hypothetical protein
MSASIVSAKSGSSGSNGSKVIYPKKNIIQSRPNKVQGRKAKSNLRGSRVLNTSLLSDMDLPKTQYVTSENLRAIKNQRKTSKTIKTESIIKPDNKKLMNKPNSIRNIPSVNNNRVVNNSFISTHDKPPKRGKGEKMEYFVKFNDEAFKFWLHKDNMTVLDLQKSIEKRFKIP